MAMALVRNERHSYQPILAEGDFVDVRFNAAVSHGFLGFVVSASTERLRLKVHQDVSGTFEEDCLNWDVVIPMTSILWIRHLTARPTDCDCGGDA